MTKAYHHVTEGDTTRLKRLNYFYLTLISPTGLMRVTCRYKGTIPFKFPSNLFL